MRFGVYVHVPFCTRRCDYCAFATWTDRLHLVDDYVEACVADMGRRDLPAASSVYLGGGTPSLLAPAAVGRLVGAVRRARDAEVTIECNPDTVDAARLAGYRDAGVTRLSFGVQSMVPEVLAALGRSHGPDAVRRAVDAAGRAGFADAYSVDLIFGAAGETADQWARSVTDVLRLDPPPRHVSAYGLTVEPGTPLAADRSRHPDPDEEAEKYLAAEELLGGAGLAWYEVSNWSVPGAECRHNQLYWEQGDYAGFGCAAHSHRWEAGGGSRRWWNVRTPQRYIRLVGSGADPTAAGEHLDAAARVEEGLGLALRTRSGVPASALPDDPALEGLVERYGERVRLTLRGRLLANEVALRLRAPAP